jgi:hypothetical protein
MKTNSIRDIYLYDTFGGLTEPSQYDYTCKDSKLYNMNKTEVNDLWKSGIISEKINLFCYTPLEKVQNRLNSTGYPTENLHYVVGDVMETLKDKSLIPEKRETKREPYYEQELREVYKSLSKKMQEI